MIACDQYVTEFIAGNWLTISIALGLLKGLANMTPSVKDDKIVTLFSNIFGGLKRGKNNPNPGQ